jgi:hypothetical protein
MVERVGRGSLTERWELGWEVAETSPGSQSSATSQPKQNYG